MDGNEGRQSKVLTQRNFAGDISMTFDSNGTGNAHAGHPVLDGDKRAVALGVEITAIGREKTTVVRGIATIDSEKTLRSAQFLMRLSGQGQKGETSVRAGTT
jgi:hypothetical protein